MIQTFLNWLKLDAQNLIVEVWWIPLILWLALVVVGVVDVANNTLTRRAKIIWIAAILLVPLVGLFAYSTFCLARADYHMLEFLFRKRKRTHRRDSRASTLTH